MNAYVQIRKSDVFTTEIRATLDVWHKILVDDSEKRFAGNLDECVAEELAARLYKDFYGAIIKEYQTLVQGVLYQCNGQKAMEVSRFFNAMDQVIMGHRKDILDAVKAALSEARQKPSDRRSWENAMYEELLYAVARVFPNESRHETALRYIREREASTAGGPAMEAKT